VKTQQDGIIREPGMRHPVSLSDQDIEPRTGCNRNGRLVDGNLRISADRFGCSSDNSPQDQGLDIRTEMS
jgi:hypothetical protein